MQLRRLPHTDEEISVLADMVKKPMGAIKERIKNLEEVNPMLGHRGCRLGITYPEIYEMQVKAIFNAVCDLQDEGMTIEPEVMIPLVGLKNY